MGEDSGMTGDVQDAANKLADDAQKVVNAIYDLGEDAAKALLSTLSSVVATVAGAVDDLSTKVAGE